MNAGQTPGPPASAPGLDSARLPTRPVRMGPRAARVEYRPDGSVRLCHAQPPLPCSETWNTRLASWAASRPSQPLLTEASPAGRIGWTFASALRDARAIAAALLELPVSAERPLAILSENSIACAQITLGALFAGIPVSPVSPSYALLAKDHTRLAQTLQALGAGAVFVADGIRYGAAVGAVADDAMPIISAGAAVPGRQGIRLSELLAGHPTARSSASEAGVTGDTIAKIMFTSGSSGQPKPVIQTHRMLADNRQQTMLVYAFLQDEPPVLVDWLPWHHTFGGNNNFGMALWAGGTLHIDDGTPTPAGIGRTVANLKTYPPNLYINSPGGIEALIPHLRDDTALRTAFFSNLKVMQYGGALLATHVWKHIDDIAVAETGSRILMVSGLGSTECGPTPVQSSWEQFRKPEAGLPVPGVTAKLVPFEDTWELRLKGDCVTAGYWKRPDLTAKAFDEEGFFLTGDAVRPVDPHDLARGLLFDGRIADNFKLVTGTWVPVTALRLQLLAAMAPLMSDAVITGHDRDAVGAIGFADLAAARAISGAAIGCSLADMLASATLRAWVSARLTALAASATGSSHRIARLVLEPELPSLETGELTDKATASPRAVLARRARVVDELYAEPAGERIIVTR